MVDFPSAQLEIFGGRWHRPRGSQHDLEGLAWLPSGASGYVACVLALLMLWASVTHSFIHQIVLRPDSLVLRGALGCMVGRLGTVSILRRLDYFPGHRWSWRPSPGLGAGTVSAWVLTAVVGDTLLEWLRVGDEEVAEKLGNRLQTCTACER